MRHACAARRFGRFGPTKQLWINWWVGQKSCNFPPLLGQGEGKSTIQHGDPKVGWWLVPRGHLVCFHFGRRRIGQDGGMFTQVSYSRVCSP